MLLGATVTPVAHAEAGSVSLSVRIVSSGVLDVVVKNDGLTSICLGPNQAANRRVTATLYGQPLKQTNAFEGRPISDCNVLPAGHTERFSYDLIALYPGWDLRSGRVCYTLPWRPNPGDALRRLTRCRAPN